jgi:hypothetical protein
MSGPLSPGRRVPPRRAWDRGCRDRVYSSDPATRPNRTSCLISLSPVRLDRASRLSCVGYGQECVAPRRWASKPAVVGASGDLWLATVRGLMRTGVERGSTPLSGGPARAGNRGWAVAHRQAASVPDDQKGWLRRDLDRAVPDALRSVGSGGVSASSLWGRSDRLPDDLEWSGSTLALAEHRRPGLQTRARSARACQRCDCRVCGAAGDWPSELQSSGQHRCKYLVNS